MNSLKLQRQKRFLNRIFRFLTPILFIVVFALAYHLFVNKMGIFNISIVETSGAKTFVNETDLRELALTRGFGKNILTFNTEDLENTLEGNFQGAKEIRVSKRLPKTLNIFVVERTPLAIVYNLDSDDEFLVDENGYVLGLIAHGTSNLPKILYEGNVEVGFFLNAKSVSVYFELLKALDDEEVIVTSASVYPEHLLVYLKNSIQVLVDAKKDAVDSARTLSRLLEQLSSQGKSPKRVDLRFNKVVVSYD